MANNSQQHRSQQNRSQQEPINYTTQSLAFGPYMNFARNANFPTNSGFAFPQIAIVPPKMNSKDSEIPAQNTFSMTESLHFLAQAETIIKADSNKVDFIGPPNVCMFCPSKVNPGLDIILTRSQVWPSCDHCSLIRGKLFEQISQPQEKYYCSYCSTKELTFHDLYNHLRLHYEKTVCTCPGQPQNDEDTKLIRGDDFDKMAIKGEPKKLLYCRCCSYFAVHEKFLKRHMLTHSGEQPFRCKRCIFRASDMGTLRNHDKEFHLEERPYKCPHCPYRAAQKGTLNTHIKIHTGEKPFRCDHCEYKSSNQSNLNSHIKTHTGDKPYTCHLCSYCSTQSSALKCHLRTHTGEKPYLCHQCPYKSAALGNLRSHVKSHIIKKTENLQLSPESLQISPESLQISTESLQISPESVQLSQDSVQISQNSVQISQESVQMSQNILDREISQNIA